MWKERAGGEESGKDKVQLGVPPVSRDLQPPHGPRQQRKQEASQNRPGACSSAAFPCSHHLAEPGQEASTRLHKFKPTPPAPLLKREGLWRSVINSSFTEHVKREGGAAL